MHCLFKMEQNISTINIEGLKKKLDIIITGRLRKKEDIIEAVKIQERLRKKSGSWNGAEEIRKWREKKYR